MVNFFQVVEGSAEFRGRVSGPSLGAEMQSFLVISKTPRADTLRQFGYQPTSQAGVYKSDNILLTDVPLLVLNKLGNERHNIYFKLFASRKAAKKEALKIWGGKGHWQGLSSILQVKSF